MVTLRNVLGASSLGSGGGEKTGESDARSIGISGIPCWFQILKMKSEHDRI